MSRTTVLGVVPDRRPVTLAELGNPFGLAPSIWSRLLTHHGRQGDWFRDGAGLDWLWRSIDDLPAWQQAALVLTFDTGVVPFTAFGWAAEQLDEFEAKLPAPPENGNHVPVLAALLRTNPEVPLIGVWGTSVTENPFDPWNEEADEPGDGISLDQMYLLPQHTSPTRPNSGPS